MAAAGLWTTPTDLANFALAVAAAKHGARDRAISPATARVMLTPGVEVGEITLGNEQHRDRMGLGFFLGDATRPDLFGHIGDDPGFQAMLMMFADSGQGVAVMANSENGILLGDYLIERIAKEYGWKGTSRRYGSKSVPHPCCLRFSRPRASRRRWTHTGN